MSFAVGAEESSFAESVRAALAGREPADWAPGGAVDDRDPDLSARLTELGLEEAVGAGHGFVAAAGIELGRALAPLAIFDELALGDVALATDGLARYAQGRSLALDLRETGAFLVPLDGAPAQPALDGEGFTRLADADGHGQAAAFPDLAAWASFHVAYLAGLSAAALALAVEHARARVQFERPLLSLAPVQQMLADAETLAAGLELLAREPREDPWPALVHAGEAACRVCEVSHQVHGAIGFALEAAVHSYFRRAHATRLFTRAVARAARAAHAA